MRVTLLASAAFAVPTLHALLDAGHELSVGTQPARPAGRKRSVTRPTDVGRVCEELGLPPQELADVNSPEGLSWLSATQPDLVAVVAFGQKLGPAVRAVAPWGCVNTHPSLLPRWRGAAPVPAAILAGDETTGVCIIDVVERMDAGDVLAMRKTPVKHKTAGELLDELAQTGAELMLEVIDALVRDEVSRRPQDEAAVTKARKLTSDDGRVRWEHEAVEIDRRVRAVTPRPGAHAQLEDGKRLKILAGEPVTWGRGHLPGEVVRADADGVVVAAGVDAYRITRLQRDGGKPMDAEAFLRGHALLAGARLGP
jgi:methionyl-tRNA formyltransferase